MGMSNLNITTIQSNLHWEDRDANLEMFEKKINSIGHRSEIVVLPEMFNTGFSMKPELLAETMSGPTIEWMKRIALQKKIILTGSLMIEEDGNYFNRLIWMLPSGEHGFYDKRHRFAHGGEDDKFSPGNRRLIASVKGWKLNLLVCYDLRFPVWARQQLSGIHGQMGEDQEPFEVDYVPEYDILVYVANWPERRSQAWKTLLQARAIENQCYVVGVNRVGKDGHDNYHSGDSMVVDPMGEVLYTKAHEEDIHTIGLDRERLLDIRTKLPFLKDADKFHIES